MCFSPICDNLLKTPDLQVSVYNEEANSGYLSMFAVELVPLVDNTGKPTY